MKYLNIMSNYKVSFLREPDKFLNLIDNKINMNTFKKYFKDTFILDNCISNSIFIE